MSAFEKSDAEQGASNGSRLTLKDHLAMLDSAYSRQDRAACARFINDLYAHFDAKEGG